MGSIGWRMGSGESWLMMWWAWLEQQPEDRSFRLAYLKRHPPAPRTWLRAALNVVDPARAADDDDDDDDEGPPDPARLRELEQHGLVADDAAIVAWTRRNDPPDPPWARNRSVKAAVRYGARALGLFVRWAVHRRGRGRLAAWSAAAPPPPYTWEPFRDALLSGELPPSLPDDPREQLAVLLAAHGEPPPPWTRGEDPPALERHFQEPTTYAGAWAEWVLDSFDDPTTFTGYLARCPAAPPEWDQAVREALPWLLA